MISEASFANRGNGCLLSPLRSKTRSDHFTYFQHNGYLLEPGKPVRLGRRVLEIVAALVEHPGEWSMADGRCTRARSLLAALSCAMVSGAPLSEAVKPDHTGAAQNRYSARLFVSINAYRVKHGVKELSPAANLDVLAQEHSKRMAQAGQLSHEGFRERGMRSDSPVCVENVGWNYTSPEAQLKAWIESPGHDRNMLDPKITKAGIGEANAYVTFIACR